ncbi:MAG: carboxypeptidase regulatory-like domain-containing protein [Candidatus Omnitrophota bacterium]|nr:carboxypeptidase regulatory-like domain-containing protein [Candidatus Omnitrophota bacterium]MDZ4242684.1 carboxypeptidase regulatory-like domain-containing protein [Candidatus Omnitrophota bacterium]
MKKYFITLPGIIMSAAFLTGSSWAATLTGTVKYDGTVPKFKALKMDADPVCLTHHAAEVYPETLVLGDGNTMGNVFVHVKSGLASQNFPAPAEEIVITQKGCQYSPHVIGVMVGQPVKILNPDGTLHNVHALSKENEEFNTAMPKYRTEMIKVFTKPEFMFPIKCDVHPWMGAWIAVMPHPFFSVTPKEGTFTIANLPAGTYEIEAWHEKLGAQKTSVTVTADETKTLDFTFSKPATKE